MVLHEVREGREAGEARPAPPPSSSVGEVSVCGSCGVAIAAAKNGRLVHLDDLPKGSDPDHEIVAVATSDFVQAEESRFTLKGAAEDMLAHHATLHPATECEWAEVLRRALVSA